MKPYSKSSILFTIFAMITTGNVIAQPIGRITGEDGAPSENTRTMIDQAVAAAETIRSELAAIIDGSVAAYRAALISAGYTPIGGAL